MLIQQVTFQKLSRWQLSDCMFCGTAATQEAYLRHELGSSNVRCCVSEVCKINASLMAVQIYEANERRLESAKV